MKVAALQRHSFATLYRSAAGAFYGTTYNGGPANEGVVFEYSSAGYKVVYGFKGGTDGANPYAGVTADSAGNLYGTTYGGGASNAGVVYKVDPSGQETVLYAFTGGTDGGYPYAGVIVDSSTRAGLRTVETVSQKEFFPSIKGKRG